MGRWMLSIWLWPVAVAVVLAQTVPVAAVLEDY
jgi:hypothetical protein